jgi:hypothetical protein
LEETVVKVLLAAHCSGDMHELIRNEAKCHRREILKHFSGEHKIVAPGCVVTFVLKIAHVQV